MSTLSGKFLEQNKMVWCFFKHFEHFRNNITLELLRRRNLHFKSPCKTNWHQVKYQDFFHDDFSYSSHKVDCSRFVFKHTSRASLYNRETGDVLKQMEQLLPCFLGFFNTFRDNEHGCLPQNLKTLLAVGRAPRES